MGWSGHMCATHLQSVFISTLSFARPSVKVLLLSHMSTCQSMGRGSQCLSCLIQACGTFSCRGWGSSAPPLDPWGVFFFIQAYCFFLLLSLLCVSIDYLGTV
jgi:hypothetical protein